MSFSSSSVTNGPTTALPRVAARSSELLISVSPPTSGREQPRQAGDGAAEDEREPLVETQRQRLRRDLTEDEDERREDGGARGLRERSGTCWR